MWNGRQTWDKWQGIQDICPQLSRKRLCLLFSRITHQPKVANDQWPVHGVFTFECLTLEGSRGREAACAPFCHVISPRSTVYSQHASSAQKPSCRKCDPPLTAHVSSLPPLIISCIVPVRAPITLFVSFTLFLSPFLVPSPISTFT